MADKMTRAEALALEPRATLAAGLTEPLVEAVRVVAPLALAEQLRAAMVPLAGLEMWIALLHRTQEEPACTTETLDRLRRDMAFHAEGWSVLQRWAEAIGERIEAKASVGGAIELCLLARQIWMLGDVLRAGDPGAVA